MSKLKLTYFDCYGRGGTIKLFLKLANVDFEDVLIPINSSWFENKANLKLPLGQLPVLEIDGFQLCQTRAIENYAAKKAGLLEKCALTDAKGEMLLETLVDTRTKIWIGTFAALAAQFPTVPGTLRLVDDNDENRKKRAAAMAENFRKMMNAKIADFDKILSLIQSNENFCVGDSLSSIDIHVVSYYIFSKDSVIGFDFQEYSPKLFKTAENIINKNQQIKDFVDDFLASGKPCTAIGIMY